MNDHFMNNHRSYASSFILLLILFYSNFSFSHQTDLLLAQANRKINSFHDKETTQRFNEWEKLIYHNVNKTPSEKLTLVNNFFNKMKWAEDKTLWNEKDYWATPIESLIKNAGDCEDFSIAKYFTLLAMDIPEKKLRITYVILDNQQGHMVLFYYPDKDKEPLVLDNMRNEIIAKSNRPDIRYLFSFNDSGLWLRDNNTMQPNEKNIIKKWSQMINRIKRN